MAPLDRNRLLQATEELLTTGGVAAVSISSVAHRAGVSRVTLHRNEISTESLLAELVTRAAEDLRSSLWPALTLDGPAVDRLAAALSTLCDVVERHAAVLAALYDQPDRIRGADRAPSFEFVEPFEQLLRDGATDGTLRHRDREAEALLLVNSVTWTYLHMRRAHRWSGQQARERTIALCGAAFRTTRPTEPK